jgi:hypothetical protein
MARAKSGRPYLEVAGAGDLRAALRRAAVAGPEPPLAASESSASASASASADADGGELLVGLARLALALEYMHHHQLLHRDIKVGRCRLNL